MLSLLADILPLMLAAASNPAVISIVVLLLTASDRPLPRAIAFVAGFALVLVALGVVGLLLFRSSRETFGTGGAREHHDAEHDVEPREQGATRAAPSRDRDRA